MLVARAAKLVGQRVSADRLDHIDSSAQNSFESDPLSTLKNAWAKAGLDGAPKRLNRPKPADMPFIIVQEGRWYFIDAVLDEGKWRAVAADDGSISAVDLRDAISITLPGRNRRARASMSAKSLIKRAIFQHKPVFISAILATGLVSLLALATSLYAMQVYDRVIPNLGFETLKVLTVGVAASVLLELLLKLLRSHIVDSTGNDVDESLSRWFFDRMLGIRMESRPSSVGTLASQIKGFELVRGVLASTSIFALADVPFAAFFVFVIYLVGGPVVIVPLVFIPLALLAGLLFQQLIHRHTHQKLASSNQKSGLLIEAVDGAETLKCYGAEWSIQSRWNELVTESGYSDLKLRRYTAFSQNVSAALQQLGYIALIATGAYFVTQNELTMGGLLACSIIGNRAMQPIIQLPGTMMQWALAKAALKGLDQIIELPNDADEEHKTLMPEILDSSLRFERTRFAYGATSQVVLDIERLDIKAGESVGILGAIGSGKSTLLKLASGLYRPLEGKVSLGGVDLASLGGIAIRENIGYLAQDPKLFSGTLRDNILLGLPDPGEEAIMQAARRTGLATLILSQPAGLALPISEGGRGVSGGQKQLVALTRLLLAKPKVWLLDEPTGAMDSMTEMAVVKLLGEIIQEGTTVIVTTHKTALLSLFGRLMIMQGGRLQLDGPRDSVLSTLSAKAKEAKESAGGRA